MCKVTQVLMDIGAQHTYKELSIWAAVGHASAVL